MGAIARAMAARQVATEVTYQPVTEPTQAKEVAIGRENSQKNRQNRQSDKRSSTQKITQVTDIKGFNQKSRQIDGIDGGRGVDKVKAANDGLEVNQIDTTSGLNEADKVKPTGNVIIREVNGINIPMPEHYSDGSNLAFWKAPASEMAAKQERYSDADWIQSMLLKLPASKRTQVSREYSARYKAIYDAEPDDNKKANKAALTANSWLRSKMNHTGFVGG
ncbi:hypothetical protein QWY20_01830 [Alkalimonas sp. MEB108]|uniref:Uncharacterized protein n=1 Tax=Alkalimonas cellulosilytica TaxID=3058395 RepID=A0ABU7J101_9GAMM|nr:hypothetical protein [Alkalimonas sp. MEB108]MEE2000178.1 hypothetical protein [Alkalimonas sp. MEB108]